MVRKGLLKRHPELVERLKHERLVDLASECGVSSPLLSQARRKLGYSLMPGINGRTALLNRLGAPALHKALDEALIEASND